MESVNAPEIGPIVQRERKKRGLTLEQLAGLSKVSKSMLSQIERSQANPTFAVLWSLTRALNIDLANLLGGGGGDAPAEAGAVEVVPAAYTPEFKNADASCRLRTLSPPDLAGITEWYEVEMAPSGALDSAAHAGGAFEHFTAFTPGFEVKSGQSVRTLNAGETARYRADVPHRIRNTSTRNAKGLMVVIYR
jgi:transcriptional regulator with XRE-family HTH domain